jgi:hypothetical protein
MGVEEAEQSLAAVFELVLQAQNLKGVDGELGVGRFAPVGAGDDAGWERSFGADEKPTGLLGPARSRGLDQGVGQRTSLHSLRDR